MKSKPGIWLGAVATARLIGRMSFRLAFPWRPPVLVWCAPGRIKSLGVFASMQGLWRPLPLFVAWSTLYHRDFLGIAATRRAFLKTAANVAGRG